MLALISGILFKKNPPKEINLWYGYRTKRSMRNQERWDFAQKIGADNMIRYSSIPFLTTVFSFFIAIEHVEWSIGIVVTGAILWAFFSIYKTEKN